MYTVFRLWNPKPEAVSKLRKQAKALDNLIVSALLGLLVELLQVLDIVGASKEDRSTLVNTGRHDIKDTLSSSSRNTTSLHETNRGEN